MAATKLVIRDGCAFSVYDDRWQCIVSAIGQPTITRATEVEHNGTEWEATHRATGHIIAHGTNRAAVIDAEVKFLEEKL